MTSYDAYLFDLDGVLLDFSRDLSGYTTTVERAFTENGIDPEPADVAAFARYDSLDVDRLRSICEKYDAQLGDVWGERESLASEYQNQHIDEGERAPYEDVEDVRELVSENPSAVVSNNQHATVEYAVEALELDFDAVYGREPTVEGIERGKPSPHYVEKGLDDLRLNGRRRNAVYVGDSESDVRSAQRAGMDSVLVVRSHTPDPSEMDAEPTHSVRSLGKLRGL